MSWADTVIATALAALAERTATAGRLFVTTTWSGNPHDVWLTRVKQPREQPARSSRNEQSTPPPLA
jgi:ABC-type transporter Mla maintaining outer membrane lipid asymmetry permease subunit MlaE